MTANKDLKLLSVLHDPSPPTPPPPHPTRRPRTLPTLIIASCCLFLGSTVFPGFSSSLSIPLPKLLKLGSSCSHHAAPSASSAFEEWVKTQTTRSWRGVLDNIGPSGSKSSGAYTGVVIASPSTEDPDYLYTWIRDAALVTKGLVEELNSAGNLRTSQIERVLKDYATSQARLQHVANPSGTFDDGGLGEPKLHINETAFTGSWGRPQRDGPALRATTLIEFAKYLGNSSTFVKDALVPVIEADLEYTVRYWNHTGFDLWEEVQGSSFFTTAAQYRALVEGYTLTANASYKAAAKQVLCFLQDFWNEEGYVVSNINTSVDRTGKDVNSILTSNHLFDAASATCDSTTFQPCSDKALINHKSVVDSFRNVYSLNEKISNGTGVAIGRYAEDVYYGGNPWYLATLAAAEQLYNALYTWDKAEELNITSVSLPFFQDLVPSTAIGSYSAKSRTFRDVSDAVRVYADSFLAIVQRYAPSDGALAEQFERTSGEPLSAKDLTWSYSAFLTASAARVGQVAGGWRSEEILPNCGRGEVVQVTFHELAETVYGETILIVGSVPALGSWSPSAAVPLSADDYDDANPLWKASVYLPASTRIEYKFIRRTASGDVVWESDPNRVIDTYEREVQVLDSSWR